MNAMLIHDTRFRVLIAILLLVLPFEVLSLLSVPIPWWISYPVLLPIIGYTGWPVFRKAIRSLSKGSVSSINVLVSIATMGALYLRQPEEAAIITALFALGEALESFGVSRSQSALQHLVSSSPKTAQKRGTSSTTPVDEIRTDDVIIVMSGDQIPLDGLVIKGRSLVDEATITGEPLPHNRGEGDSVFAGTFNSDGYLEIKVTREARDSTLAKIIELTYKSAEKKATSQRLIERFAFYYTPTMMALSLALVLVPVLLYRQPFDAWLTSALSLLVIACPCALVISTPVAVFSAIGNATGKGILVKGGRYMEAMGTVKAIGFDKTRTLTKGEPVVTDVQPLAGTGTEELLACAAGIEAFSKHPLAKSITDKAREWNLDVHAFENFHSVPGKGVKGDCLVCSDRHHCLGVARFVAEEHDLNESVLRHVDEFERQGKTTVVLSSHGKVKGVIGIADRIRPESKKAIRQLKSLGLHAAMLTGDNQVSASHVARELEITDVHAELLPDAKVAVLKTLEGAYGPTAMVGDGVNDAAALASATVGIAMGAIGSDIALENADIALMTENLSLLPFLVRLGRACRRLVRVNVAAAILIKAVFIALALSGHTSLALAVFADVGVTILVILNSLRLFHFA